MNEYDVLITEVLERKVTVKAKTMSDAISVVKEKHENEEIVLDVNDFGRVDFTIAI